jgi:hypothetical protein
LRNNRINLKAQAQNQSADYADYTDFKTKRLRELEAQWKTGTSLLFFHLRNNRSNLKKRGEQPLPD